MFSAHLLRPLRFRRILCNPGLSIASGLFGCVSAFAQPDYGPALWSPAYANHWYTTGNSHSFCVIHDMEGYYLSTISYFQQSGTQASAHFCVNGLQDNGSDHPAGEITQMVREQYWAWHALCWNRYSFGTEHEGFVSNPAWYTEAMYQASAGLQRHLCNTWGIPKDRNHIIGHNEWQNASWTSWMAANWPAIDPTCNNHTDPGQYWDWNHFMALIVNAPSAPTNLVTTPLSTNQIKLSWTDTATNETGFKVERALASAGPWTQIATPGSNTTVYTNSGLSASTIYYYRVRAYNGNGDSEYSNIRSATTANAAPVLGTIGNRTVTELTPLNFIATAADAALGAVNLVSDFESFANGATMVMFQNPSYSGSSRGLDTNVTTSTTVTTSFPAGHASAKVIKATWGFLAGASDPWLRLTTFNSSGVPNPVVDFTQVIRFDIYCDQPLRLGIGLRETTNAAGTAIGANGGSAGTIEWAGVTNTAPGGAPIPSRILSTGTWQTVQFNLPGEAIRAFTGNGVLSTASGLGVLEHLALVPTSNAGGTYNVYLDNFSVVYSNVLTFSLDAGAPAGASIAATNGAFSWTPTEAQGPGVYDITVRVTDNGTPPLSDFETFAVTVNESNSPPSLAALSNRTVTEGNLLSFSTSATDPDIPANLLTYTLDAGAPAGATVDPNTGQFNWVPSEAQGPGVYSITARVTDLNVDAINSTQLSAARTFSVTVTESNSAPVLPAIPDQTILLGSTLSVTNAATDPDMPANVLTYSLDPGTPIGATIGATDGILRWTPAPDQLGSTNQLTVRVIDDGVPPLSATAAFSAVVARPPIVLAISLSGTNALITWTAVPGKTYRAQYKINLDDPVWNDLSPDVTAVSTSASTTDPLHAASRYYRVLSLD